jgi:sugar lactone lactonase YvrE
MAATDPAFPLLSLSAVQTVGAGLVRPECVLATESALYTADWRGGVARIDSTGSVELFAGALPGGRPLRPNGIALRRDGSFLLADLGETAGGVFALDRRGQVRPVLERVDGVDLPPTNFVFEDRAGRIWVTVSTRHVPRASAYRADVADGFVVLIDDNGARIVTDGLGYTNEAALSADGHWLYVNETFGRRLSRFRVGADGSLSGREVVTTFGHGTYPDGLAFDAEGNAWITSIVSNRVLRVAPDGSTAVILEDAEPGHLQRCEEAYLAGQMGRPHLDQAAGKRLRNISSLAFGGPDLRTAFLGCLLGDSVMHFRAPVQGLAPVHWRYPAP